MKLARTIAQHTVGLELYEHQTVKVKRWWRNLMRKDQSMRDQYLASSNEPKLHLGANCHCLAGWLNTDLVPGDGVSIIDATRPYPLPPDTFHFVYAEHMIEHISHKDGAKMVTECYRVLRKGGVIRLVTPDLAAVLGIYSAQLSPTQQAYLDWMARTFTPESPTPSAIHVINAMFRLWGHQFLYDESTLSQALHDAGFKNVRRCRLDESDCVQLRDLANSTRYPPGLLEFESLCLEASKP